MKQFLRSVMVVARRDFTATVFSRYFLLFLLGPLIAFGFSIGAAMLGKKSDQEVLRPIVAIVAAPPMLYAVRAAEARLVKRAGPRFLPGLRYIAATGDPARQAATLLMAPDITGVVTGLPDAPIVTGAKPGVNRVESDLRLLLNEAARVPVGAEVSLRIHAVDPAGAAAGAKGVRHLLGRGAQVILFMLTMLLAGMMLSNLVEEKSNKILEILAAALPIDTIFFGKLVAMVGVSLVGIFAWGTMLGVGASYVMGQVGALPVPAVGWPVMAVLGVVYFITSYMIMGGIFLGIGAQAGSVREVQTLSMPVSMAQVAVFALISAITPGAQTPMGRVAELFPLSSPMAMLGRAATDAAIWPHLAAIAWQALWVVIIVRFASTRFRSGVLKSGAPPAAERKWWALRH